MSRAIQDATGCREALARLPKLGLRELRQQWRVLYKAEASRTSTASFCCELSHTGCRRSFSAASVRSGSASFVNLLNTSTTAKRGGYVLVPS